MVLIMKQFKLLPIMLLVCLFFISITAYASPNDYAVKDQEIVLDLSMNSDGVTVTFVKQPDGSYKYMSQEDKMRSAPSEGEMTSAVSQVDVVTFHVGVRNWTNSQADLYWEATSTTPNLTAVNGNIYIKSTNILFPKTYANVTAIIRILQ